MKAEHETSKTGNTPIMIIRYPEGRIPTEKEMNDMAEKIENQFLNPSPKDVFTFSYNKLPVITKLDDEVEIDFQNPKYVDSCYLAFWDCTKCKTDSITNFSKYCFECGSKVKRTNTLMDRLQKTTRNPKTKKNK